VDEIDRTITVIQPCVLCEEPMEIWHYVWVLGQKRPDIIIEPPVGGPHYCTALAELAQERFPTASEIMKREIRAGSRRKPKR
jgi:hypothetical protein